MVSWVSVLSITILQFVRWEQRSFWKPVCNSYRLWFLHHMNSAHKEHKHDAQTEHLSRENTHDNRSMCCCITWAGHLNTSDPSATGYSYPHVSVLQPIFEQNSSDAHIEYALCPVPNQLLSLNHQREKRGKIIHVKTYPPCLPVS